MIDLSVHIERMKAHIEADENHAALVHEKMGCLNEL